MQTMLEDAKEEKLNLAKKFILSHNDTPKVRELYKGFHIKEVETRYTLNGKSSKQVGEVVIWNF